MGLLYPARVCFSLLLVGPSNLDRMDCLRRSLERVRTVSYRNVANIGFPVVLPCKRESKFSTSFPLVSLTPPPPLYRIATLRSCSSGHPLCFLFCSVLRRSPAESCRPSAPNPSKPLETTEKKNGPKKTLREVRGKMGAVFRACSGGAPGICPRCHPVSCSMAGSGGVSGASHGVHRAGVCWWCGTGGGGEER